MSTGDAIVLKVYHAEPSSRARRIMEAHVPFSKADGIFDMVTDAICARNGGRFPVGSRYYFSMTSEGTAQGK